MNVKNLLLCLYIYSCLLKELNLYHITYPQKCSAYKKEYYTDI